MAYRRIDVDALDGDTFVDDDELVFGRVQQQPNADESTTSTATTAQQCALTNCPSPVADSMMSSVDWPSAQRQQQERVRACLNRGDCAGALECALPPAALFAHPAQLCAQVPLGARPPAEVKHKQLALVMDALLAHKPADIPKTLQGGKFSVGQLDLLMQYIYRGILCDLLSLSLCSICSSSIRFTYLK